MKKETRFEQFAETGLRRSLTRNYLINIIFFTCEKVS
jgi:hypothetical protein